MNRRLLLRIALLTGLTACGNKASPTATAQAEPPEDATEGTDPIPEVSPEAPTAPADGSDPDVIPEVGDAESAVVPESSETAPLPEGALFCLTLDEAAALYADGSGACPPTIHPEKVDHLLEPAQNPQNLSLPHEITHMNLGDAERCCYTLEASLPPPEPVPRKGRPMLTDQGVALPDLRMERPSAHAAAFAWREDARHEHSSVAAFERAAAELELAGAPAELVARCRVAAEDEARHAQACLRIATRLDGRTAALGPMPDWSPRPLSIEELAAATLVEGAIPETLAAAEARLAAERCTDPAIQEVLETIATEEQRHADLAWAIVGWCRTVGGDGVDRALIGAFQRPGQPDETRDDHGGRLGRQAREALFDEMFAEVLDPVHRSLSRSSTPARA